MRVLLDLEQDRPRAAAVGFKGAFDLLLGEFSGRILAGSVRTRLEALIDEREVITGFASTATHGPLPDADVERLTYQDVLQRREIVKQRLEEARRRERT